jgi:pyruvate/2-oxoglutarate dehydrogenase complex dihydrolipoamide acyltransferase (E2) component
MAFLQGSRFAPAMALGQRARFVQQGRLLSTIEGSGDAVADPAVAAAREARKEEKAAQKAAQKAKKAANAPAATGAAPGAVNDKITPRAEDYSKWYQVRRRQTQLFEIERAVRVA